MGKYLNKEMFLQSMGLVGDETKYGNRDGEHQSRSYGTWMGYEIMDSVEDSIVEEAIVEVLRCKDCRMFEENTEARTRFCRRGLGYMYATPDGFCSYGRRRTE